MYNFTYSSPSVIDQITFKKTENGSVRAYIHALDGTPHEALSKITETLLKKNFICVPITQDGKQVLEVRGFTHTTQMTEALSDQSFLNGDITVNKTPQLAMSFQDKVKNRSLFSAALFYLIGDVKFFSYGHKGGEILDMAAGGFYGLGTVSNLLFSRKNNADLQVHDMAQHMADYMNEQKLPVPKESSLHNIIDDKHKGKIKKADDFLRHYPAELMHACIAMAGTCIAIAAYRKLGEPVKPEAITEFLDKQVKTVENMVPGIKVSKARKAAMEVNVTKTLTKHHKVANVMDIGLGTVSLASGAFGALVKEKVHDPDKPRKHGLEGVWEKIQEHPLTVSGIGLMASTMCHGVSTGIAYKVGSTDAKKAVFDRGVFVVTNLMAEFLIAISSKGHGEGVVSDKTVDDSTIAIAAELIIKHPANEQPKLIDYLANFLGRNDVLAMKDIDVRDKLTAQVEQMKNNPWSICSTQTAKQPAKSKESNDLPQNSWQQLVRGDAPAPAPVGR